MSNHLLQIGQLKGKNIASIRATKHVYELVIVSNSSPLPLVPSSLLLVTHILLKFIDLCKESFETRMGRVHRCDTGDELHRLIGHVLVLSQKRITREGEGGRKRETQDKGKQ